MCGLTGGIKKEKRLTRTNINLLSVSLSFSVSLFSPYFSFAGTTSRRCSLDHRGVAYWEQPSYARCIANEYRYLQQSVGAKSASCALLLFVTCHKLPLQSSRSPKLFPPVPFPPGNPDHHTGLQDKLLSSERQIKPLVLQFLRPRINGGLALISCKILEMVVPASPELFLGTHLLDMNE